MKQASNTAVPDFQDAAYRFLPRLLPKPDDETPSAGWAVLFKGSGVPAYLVAYSWTWVNVVECRVAVAGLPELGCADENPEHFTLLDRRWIGCVWEIAPVRPMTVAFSGGLGPAWALPTELGAFWSPDHLGPAG
jgi:hypothetical protein